MSFNYHIAFLVFTLFVSTSLGAPVKEKPLVLEYHNGALYRGTTTVNLVWYGNFTPAQRSTIVDFITSLSSNNAPQPSVASWWKTIEKYKNGPVNIVLGQQILNENYSLGKSLDAGKIMTLAKNIKPNTINVVLTANDVAVAELCNQCGYHKSTKFGNARMVYIWVGNAATQCLGQCAWPFHLSINGPQAKPLVAPNKDVGVDGMVINLAKLLAGTVTNPFGDGYYMGPAIAPLEAASACSGKFGSGSYPGNPGTLLKDKVTGASYNANGVNGKKFLLPAMWDPATSRCKTLV